MRRFDTKLVCMSLFHDMSKHIFSVFSVEIISYAAQSILESIHYLCVFITLFYLLDVFIILIILLTVTFSLQTVPLASRKHTNSFSLVILYERFDICKHQWPDSHMFGDQCSIKC